MRSPLTEILTLLDLQECAVTEEGNAQYECHAGAIMAGVALIGEVVSLPE